MNYQEIIITLLSTITPVLLTALGLVWAKLRSSHIIHTIERYCKQAETIKDMSGADKKKWVLNKIAIIFPKWDIDFVSRIIDTVVIPSKKKV